MTQIINTAAVTVSVNSGSDYAERFASYIVNADASPDMAVSVSDDEVCERQKSVPGLDAYSIEYCLIYEKICDQLPRFDAFMLHAAVVAYRGKAYAFSAVSGTGKSTHAALWEKLLGDKCRYINGDKPIVRILNDMPTAFGTPWNGKEGRGNRISAPLAGLCFIARGERPSIRSVNKKEGLFRVLSASHQPKDHALDDNFYHCIGKVVENVPMYELKCNISADAAKLSFETMTGERMR